MFNCAVGKEEICKQMSLAFVGSARGVWATLGLPPLTACVLSRSTLVSLQVALRGNSLKQALGCMHFPGLSHSGSGSQVLHKGTESVEPGFVPFPGPSSSGDQVLGELTLPARRCILSPSLVPAPRFPGCTVGAPPQMCRESPLGADLRLQPS